jgi:hypothetical protein
MTDQEQAKLLSLIAVAERDTPESSFDVVRELTRIHRSTGGSVEFRNACRQALCDLGCQVSQTIRAYLVMATW